MALRPEKCVGNCKRDIAAGEEMFQVYEEAFWATPYITPDRRKFLRNWHVGCFQRECGHLISSQVQPYECTLCARELVEHEQVIYVTVGTRPSAGYFRAEKRGDEIHVIVCQNCWENPRFKKLYTIHRLA
jgi:hypothetical protein